jgi:hypothetical protein
LKKILGIEKAFDGKGFKAMIDFEMAKKLKTIFDRT